MTSRLTLPAPAKLNLFLHITGRRADGYHELQTVFQFIDLCDVIEFQTRADATIELNGDTADIILQDNLIYRAATTLQRKTGCKQGATITLQKNIPMGAGLGGGSSNAATTLLALNALWATSLDLDTLARIGATLGADVPVFVHGFAAWAEGIGEQLTALELPEPIYLIIQPDCAVSTADIFCHEELTRHTTPIKMAAFLDRPSLCRNDCLPVVQKMYPQVATAMCWLDEFSPARLTGTGACIFAKFANEKMAKAVLQQLPKRWKGYVVRGLNVSPTHSRLSEEKLSNV